MGRGSANNTPPPVVYPLNLFSPFHPGPLLGIKKGYSPDRGESGGHVGERIFQKDPLEAEL